MTCHPKTLLFYPTSPSHILNLNLLAARLNGWRILCLISVFASDNSPGIIGATRRSGYDYVLFDKPDDLTNLLPEKVSVVMLGAVFEPYALELFLWAKLEGMPVVAVEEVAQLSLNDIELNNYDLPLDLLFVASKVERDLFRKAGYPEDMLTTSGLLSTESTKVSVCKEEVIKKLALDGNKKILLYTTSPIQNRYAIHNRDSRKFRKDVLRAMLSEVKGRWQLIVKLHPNENEEKERQFITNIIPDAIVLGSEWGFHDLLTIADVVMNRGNSQTVYDAIIKGCPAIVIACGIKTIFHEYGGAFVVDELSQLHGVMNKVWAAKTPSVECFVEANSYVPDGGVSSFVGQKIGQLSGKKITPTLEQWEWTAKTFLFFGMMNRLPRLFERLKEKSNLLRSIEHAVLSQEAGDREEAISHWKECSFLAPDWFYPHFELAYLFFGKNSWDECLHQVDCALKKHPPYHSYWHAIPMQIVKSSCFRAVGRHQAALEAFKPFEASGVLECMPELLIEKGRVLFEMGQGRRAMALLESAFEILRAQKPLWPEIDSQLFRQLGNLYADMADFDKQLGCIDLAYKMDKNIDIYSYLRAKARCHLKNKNYTSFFSCVLRYVCGKTKLLK